MPCRIIPATCFFRWDISVITVLKLTETAFTSLYFRILSPNWLRFFQSFKKSVCVWKKLDRKDCDIWPTLFVFAHSYPGRTKRAGTQEWKHSSIETERNTEPGPHHLHIPRSSWFLLCFVAICKSEIAAFIVLLQIKLPSQKASQHWHIIYSSGSQTGVKLPTVGNMWFFGG